MQEAIVQIVIFRFRFTVLPPVQSVRMSHTKEKKKVSSTWELTWTPDQQVWCYDNWFVTKTITTKED